MKNVCSILLIVSCVLFSAHARASGDLESIKKVESDLDTCIENSPAEKLHLCVEAADVSSRHELSVVEQRVLSGISGNRQILSLYQNSQRAWLASRSGYCEGFISRYTQGQRGRDLLVFRCDVLQTIDRVKSLIKMSL